MAASWPAGVGREIHATLDSTSAEAMRRAAGGESGPIWILADRQTSGRGRRGRRWASPPGNFAASLLYRPEDDLSRFALRSFTASLALYDALAATSGAAQLLTLKWPNDVLLAGRKLAGILLEASTPAGGAPVLVIGVGVNLQTAPQPLALEPGAVPPTSLVAETGCSLASEEFLERLAPALAHWEQRLIGEGFAPVREAWLARAARIGQRATARLATHEITGVFETVDAEGALVLRTGAGRRSVTAADLHFPPEPWEAAADAARH